MKTNIPPSWLTKVGVEFDTAWDSYRHVSTWSKVALASDAMQKGKTIFEFDKEGCIEESDFDKLTNLLEKYSKEMTLGKTNHVTSNFEEAKKGTVLSWTFWDEDTVLNVRLNVEDESSMDIMSVDRARAEKIHKDFLPLFQKRSARPGRVHLLEAGCDGLELAELGKGGEPFLSDNYEKSIAEDFEFIKTELISKTPCGRLFILDGPPGTGKTYFVRGLLDGIKGVVFLLVPSKQIASLSDPGFMPILRRLHEKEEVPIVLILEDADDALLPRDITNMSTISDLLNFADGIVGSIVDLRILATTNAKNMQIEPALKRKRRLGKSVHIGKLSKAKAEEVFGRLKNEKSVSNPVFADGKYTLAEVYALADGDDVEEEQNTRRRGGRAGF